MWELYVGAEGWQTITPRWSAILSIISQRRVESTQLCKMPLLPIFMLTSSFRLADINANSQIFSLIGIIWCCCVWKQLVNPLSIIATCRKGWISDSIFFDRLNIGALDPDQFGETDDQLDQQSSPPTAKDRKILKTWTKLRGVLRNCTWEAEPQPSRTVRSFA